MDITEYHRSTNLRRPPPGRAAHVAQNVQAVANPLGYHLLQPYTEAVVERARYYVSVRIRRMAQRDLRGGGETARIDRPIDTHVGFICETSLKYAVEMPDSPQGRAGAKVQRRYFGQGLRSVIAVAYEEQVILVDHIVDGLSGPDAALAEVLNIRHHLDALEGLLPAYRASMNLEDKVTAGEVGAAYERLQMAYLDLIFAIFTHVRDPQHRSAVLAPAFDQDDRLAAIFAARRRGRTGASLDLDAEVDALLDGELAEDVAARAADAEAEADGLDEPEAAAPEAEAPEPADTPAAQPTPTDTPEAGLPIRLGPLPSEG